MKKIISFAAFILSAIDLFIGMISINFSEEINTLVLDMNGLFSLAGIIITGICTVIVSIDYENSLKNYIVNKNK